MNAYILQMVYFNRIDVSEEIDLTKTNASKECDICHYFHFLNYSFKFQPNICNRCHYVLMLYMTLSDIAMHCVKRVQMHSFFRSLFSCIRNEYREFKSPYLV